MMKPYFFVAVLAMILNPLAWYFLLSADAAVLIYTDLSMGISATVGMGVGAILGLVIMRWVAKGAPEVLKGFLIRLVGAVIASAIAILALYLTLSWELGYMPQYSPIWWLGVHLPGFVSALVSYWIVSFLVAPVAPIPNLGSGKGNRRR